MSDSQPPKEKQPAWQKRTCYCGKPMRYVGIITTQETQAVGRIRHYEDDAEWVVEDETYTVELDEWVCPDGHDYTEYPAYRNSEGNE